MVTMTLESVPDELYLRLQERAARHRRSLESEVLAILESVIDPRPFDVGAYLERVRRLRPRGGERSTWEDFDGYKRRGRS